MMRSLMCTLAQRTNQPQYKGIVIKYSPGLITNPSVILNSRLVIGYTMKEGNRWTVWSISKNSHRHSKFANTLHKPECDNSDCPWCIVETDFDRSLSVFDNGNKELANFSKEEISSSLGIYREWLIPRKAVHLDHIAAINSGPFVIWLISKLMNLEDNKCTTPFIESAAREDVPENWTLERSWQLELCRRGLKELPKSRENFENRWRNDKSYSS
ncbi:uncharacterized protein L201_007981 [Kwoniella dendrophila CBS 6074]|uniref:Uncharacterized protein n=1 Tax=Kwoniella dendrophila CBS 6074 TaxID=1295534 RepID=A0AAX4K5T3_9TREE